MTKLDIDAENVIKIDPEGKYVLVFEGDPPSEADWEQVRDWWKRKGDPFLLISPDVKLVRIDGDDNEKD